MKLIKWGEHHCWPRFQYQMLLCLNESYSTTVIFGAHCEVDPIRPPRASLDQKFIEILLVFG